MGGWQRLARTLWKFPLFPVILIDAKYNESPIQHRRYFTIPGMTLPPDERVWPVGTDRLTS